MGTVEVPPASMASSETVAPPIVVPRYTARRVAGRDALRFLLYLAPALVLYGLFVLWPLVRVSVLSLDRWNGYGPQTFIGLANFDSLASDPVFQSALSHSVFWEVGAALLVTAAGLALALLARVARGQRVLLAALFFPALLPPTVLAAIWTLIYSPLDGLLNSALRTLGLGGLTRAWLGDPGTALPALFVAWAWSALGIGTLFFWTGLRRIGREYLELAAVEGAGSRWRLWHVLLPGIRRTAGIVLVINAALAAAVFDLIFVTTGGGPGYATMLLPVDMYGRAFGGQTGAGAAVATLQILLGLGLLAVALLVFRGESWSGETEPSGATTARPRRAASTLLWLLAAAVLFPLAWVMAIALGGSHSLGITLPALDPHTWDGSSFAGVWDAGIGGALATSAWLAVACTVGTLILAVPAAFALAELPVSRWVRRLLLVMLLIGLFQPTPVTIIPLFSLLGSLGLLDSAAGILLPEIARTIPFAALVLWTAFDQSPAEILDAGRVDGASAAQLMVRVALPLVRPAVIVVAMWVFVTSWNEYLLPTLVSQDGSLETVPTLLATFVGRFDTQYALLAAGAVLALTPVLIVYLLLAAPAAAGLARVQRRLS